MIRNLDIFGTTDSVLERLVGDFFKTGWKDISNLFNMVIAAEIFSSDCEKEFDNLQDIIFLFSYLFLMSLGTVKTKLR
jgi:hypothetical protein